MGSPFHDLFDGEKSWPKTGGWQGFFSGEFGLLFYFDGPRFLRHGDKAG
jgi:hypothetical protein